MLAISLAVTVAAVWSYRALTGEADTRSGPIAPDPAVSLTEQVLPKFEGEILGIYIANRLSAVPARFLPTGGLCEESRSVPLENAGELALSLDLPAAYALDENDLNTGAVACVGSDDPYVVRYKCRLLSATGLPSDIVIGRSKFRFETGWDVAADRVTAQDIAGRDAIVIRPIDATGRGERSAVIIPEPFGMTFIYAFSISEDELMRLAELVAGASH